MRDAALSFDTKKPSSPSQHVFPKKSGLGSWTTSALDERGLSIGRAKADCLLSLLTAGLALIAGWSKAFALTDSHQCLVQFRLVVGEKVDFSERVWAFFSGVPRFLQPRQLVSYNKASIRQEQW